MRINDTADRLGNAKRLLTGSAQNLTDGWQELLAACQELDNKVKHLEAELRQERKRNDELAATLQKVKATQDSHDARLNTLSQQRTTERLTPASHIVHHEIAQRYRTLRDQTLVHLAYVARQQVQPGHVLVDEPLALNWLSAALFSPHADHGEAVAYQYLCRGPVPLTRDQFRQAWQEASKIREDAARSGHSYLWDFEEHEGQPVDKQRQELYEGCDPNAPVTHVVTPGYVVDGTTVYVKQQVFTALKEPKPITHVPSTAGPGPGGEQSRADDRRGGKQGDQSQDHQTEQSPPQSVGGVGAVGDAGEGSRAQEAATGEPAKGVASEQEPREPGAANSGEPGADESPDGRAGKPIIRFIRLRPTD